MRDVKFRAWEKSLREMIPVYDINFETNMINTRSAWRQFNEIELMQYTGLKDKNGTEIYEGDIIEIEYYADLPTTAHMSDLTFQTICKWCADASFHLIGTGIADGKTYSMNYSGSAIKRKEVIGNIYENADLLQCA